MLICRFYPFNKRSFSSTYCFTKRFVILFLALFMWTGCCQISSANFCILVSWYRISVGSQLAIRGGPPPSPPPVEKVALRIGHG
jgi:hypothetical protein